LIKSHFKSYSILVSKFDNILDEYQLSVLLILGIISTLQILLKKEIIQKVLVSTNLCTVEILENHHGENDFVA